MPIPDKDNHSPIKLTNRLHRLKNILSISKNRLKPFINVLSNLYKKVQDSTEQLNQNSETYKIITEGSNLDREFFVLLVVSCLITTFGLFQNSVAAVIGAMLIAPLMVPILGFALGVLRGDRNLLLTSLTTLVIGSVITLGLAFILTSIIPGVSINDSIKTRMNPNLYDIVIALGSGLVGAYAFVNPKISSSISGVAIAVALMPPLCVAGIALGLNNIQGVIGAILLYITNLVSISLAAVFIFWANESTTNII